MPRVPTALCSQIQSLRSIPLSVYKFCSMVLPPFLAPYQLFIVQVTKIIIRSPNCWNSGTIRIASTRFAFEEKCVLVEMKYPRSFLNTGQGWILVDHV